MVSQLLRLHTVHFFPGHGFQRPVAQADIPSCVVCRARAEGSLLPLTPPARHQPLPGLQMMSRAKPRWRPPAEHLLRYMIPIPSTDLIIPA